MPPPDRTYDEVDDDEGAPGSSSGSAQVRRALPSEELAEGQHMMEAVVDVNTKAGVEKPYCVKWVGWKHPTWEPYDEGLQEYIDEYYEGFRDVGWHG